MLKINIQSRKIIYAKTMDLGDVILVARYSARRYGTGECDILNKPDIEYLEMTIKKTEQGVYTHCSKKLSNSSATFSPTLSTTLGTARAIGSAGRFLSVPRAPTTSSSA